MMHGCEHALYLEFHGDQAEKVDPDESLQLLFARGNEHEAGIAEELAYPEPCYETGDWETGLNETMTMMKQGVPGLYQAVLKDGRYLGKPDLLRKVDVPSDLGEWSYEVGDIKSSKKIKLEQVMQVTFYSFLLEAVQGVRPERGFIVLGDCSEESFLIDDYYWTLLDLLDEIDEILSGERRTSFHVRGACDTCAWREHCRGLAESQKDISLVYGLTQAQKRLLVPQGITSIRDVAGMDVKELSRTKGLGEAGLIRLKRQAKVLESGKPRWIGAPDLPGHRLEVYFDMESDPYSETEYLFGLMLVEGRKRRFRYFIARGPGEEKKAFAEFMGFMKDLLGTGKEFSIYHYHHYEPKHLEKLAGKYGGVRLLKDMQDRMVDLLPVIKANVVLPLTSYSLKHVARFLGFEWTGEDASAAQSVVWYNNFLADGDQKWLDLIVEYNQDDLKATKAVRDWLANRS
jgi:uncharacterized protein